MCKQGSIRFIMVHVWTEQGACLNPQITCKYPLEVGVPLKGNNGVYDFFQGCCSFIVSYFSLIFSLFVLMKLPHCTELSSPLVSFSLDEFFLPLFFMTWPVSKSTCQVLYRMSFHLDLFMLFSWLDWNYGFGRWISQEVTNMTYDPNFGRVA